MCCFIFLWKPWCISRLRFFDEYIVQNNSIYMKWESFCNIINVNFFLKICFQHFAFICIGQYFRQGSMVGERRGGGIGKGPGAGAPEAQGLYMSARCPRGYWNRHKCHFWSIQCIFVEWNHYFILLTPNFWSVVYNIFRLSVRMFNYLWRLCTPPSIWADIVLFSNLSSPEYIITLR